MSPFPRTDMLPRSLCQTLRGEEIRLLTIHSQSNFTLENASLKDGPHYVAVSHCWGDAHDLCNVQFNGYESLLRRHVSAMLGSLYHGHQVKRIWLDMVCINQNDPNEKSKQVSTMGKIYSRATRVYAWLGEADCEIDCVFDFLREFRDRKRKAELPTYLDAVEQLSFYRELFREIYQDRAGSLPEQSDVNDEKLHEEFNWLRPLYVRSYWRRVWIVQELIMAKMVFVCCGDKSIYLDDIYGLSLDWGPFEQGFDNTKLDDATFAEVTGESPELMVEREDLPRELKVLDGTITTLQHLKVSTMYKDASEKPKSHSRGWNTIQAIRGHRRRREVVEWESGGEATSLVSINMGRGPASDDY